MASSSSSASSSIRRSNMELVYDGETRYCDCHCGVVAPRWTSWTEKNPGRRFYGCRYYKVRNCRFFEWHDDEMAERAKEVINELKKENKLLAANTFGLNKINLQEQNNLVLFEEISELKAELKMVSKSKEWVWVKNALLWFFVILAMVMLKLV